jgi:hypothetical protein
VFKRFCVLFLLAAVGTICSLGETATSALQPQADPRIELLSIVFHLAGSHEYNMSSLSRYTAEIDSYFGTYKTHPAVLLAKKMSAENGVGYDAVMWMAVYLSPPPALTPIVPFTANIPESRWGAENANQFAVELQHFYKDTRFQVFFNEHQAFYQLAEKRYAAVLEKFDPGWFSKYYGIPAPGQFHLLIGLNNGGGNYGPHVVLADGHQEIYAIMGDWSEDANGDPSISHDDLPIVIHEFNHSYINPLVSRHIRQFNATDRAYRMVADQMRSQAYTTPETMVNESLVRASVILYLESIGRSQHEIAEATHVEQSNGFVWMDELCALLRQYQSQRDRYPTLNDFMPQIAKFFNKLDSRIPEERAEFERKSLHVISMQPIPNHTVDVDAGIQEIVIGFDKPLDSARRVGLSYGEGGKEHFPITARPTFLPGNQSIRFPVTLKPHWSYSFTLTPYSVETLDGYPLQTYAVVFQTK